MPSTLLHHARLVGWWIPIAFSGLVFLPGCVTPTTFNKANQDFMTVFADVSNRQLLMNIAQEANNEPAHFIQMGNFSAQFTYTRSLSPMGGGSSFSRSKGVSTVAVAPNITITLTENPSFNFTPLAGDAVTKAVFSPLSKNIFYAIFNIYHADVAMRTAVETITITPPDPATAASLVLKNDPKDATYTLFLALAYEVRNAQRARLIPSSSVSAANEELAEKAIKDAEAKAITVYGITLPDVIAAQEQDYIVTDVPADPKAPQLHAYRVYKNPSSSENLLQLPPDACLSKDYPLLKWIVSHSEHICLSMRTLDLMLFRIGKEDHLFHQMKNKDETAIRAYTSQRPDLLPPNLVTELDWQYNAKQGIAAAVTVNMPDYSAPETFLARPLLRLVDYRPDYSFVDLRHKLEKEDVEYRVGDVVEEGENPKGVTPSIPNQIEFTLLSYLFNQAAIDSTKLPVQQLIEVH